VQSVCGFVIADYTVAVAEFGLKLCFHFTLSVGEQNKCVQSMTLEGGLKGGGGCVEAQCQKYFFLCRPIDGCLVTPQ
jgi:hypothetical protein